MGQKYICGLDIGAQSVKASLMKDNGQRELELIGVYEIQALGLEGASIVDLEDLSECIQRTVTDLCDKAGADVKEVQIGLGGYFVETRCTRAVVPLNDRGTKIITFSDVNKVRNQARLLGVKLDETVLHDFAQHYLVDDENIAQNPVGLYGRKLEASVLLVVANTTRIQNLTKAVNQAGFDVGNIFFAGSAAADIILSEERKKKGCVVVDVGSVCTNVLVFNDGALQHIGKIPMGGIRVTESIAENLNLSFDLAEDIKKSYAMVVRDEQASDEEILVKKENEYIPIRREAICEAVGPEIERLVDFIEKEIHASKVKRRLNDGLVILGGGALLPGLMEVVESRVNMPVSLGKVQVGNKCLNHSAVFASSVGIAEAGFYKQNKVTDKDRKQATWAKRFTSRLKEVYQEYF